MAADDAQSPEELAAMARDKSGVVTALCVVGVIVGGIGVCAPLGFFLTYNGGGVATTQGVDPVQSDRLLFNWIVAGYIVNFVLSILLVASSIGSLTLKPEARKGMVAWAMVALAVSIGWFFLSKNILEPRFDALILTHPPDRRPPASAKTIATIKAALAVAYELLVLLVFTRAAVIESFTPARDIVT